MKFALINDVKTEASKGANGICPSCGSKLVAKCGEIKVNHWAHIGNRNCDPWWENETDWHRSWKGEFPNDWQEVVHRADSGEKHIADIKTESGWVIEFQHSYLNPEERRSRIAFYKKLVWVVDGLRRKSDKKQFQKVIKESELVSTKLPIRRVFFPEECRFLKEWQDSTVLVFFDFHETEELDNSVLWVLLPTVSTEEAYLATFGRHNFIKTHNNNEFDNIVKNKIEPIYNFLVDDNKRIKHATMIYNRPNSLRFERYLANKQRNQTRL